MTAKPPNTSGLTPAPQRETLATVYFDRILDSSGKLVANNGITFDTMLKLEGRANANTALRIRDRFQFMSDVSSGSSGTWIKELNFSNQEFKRFSLNVIERDPPQDFSDQYVFVLATETPTITKVTGKNGPINDGDTYNGDSLEFTGHAPPNMEVEALDGDTPTGKKETVNADGLFKLTFDGLTPGTYAVKIRAANDKESSVFTFKVALDVALSLDDVVDSKGSITEGGTTYEDKVTVNGYASPGEEVRLRNNDTPIDGATATARADDGFWEIELDVPPCLYSLTVEALYGDGEISTPPRTFTVALDVELSLDDVADSNGAIPENGTTYDDKVTVSGYARPGNRVQLRNHDVPVGGATATAREDDGFWEIEIDVPPSTYSLTVEALYGDGEISTPPRTFTVALDVELSLDDVLESEDGPSVPEDGTTDKNKLIIKGHARPGESIQLLNNGNPIKDATASADPDDGAWQILLDVTDGDYSLAAQANYGENEITAPPRTFTVASTIKPHNTRVYDSDGPIEDNGSTPYNYVIVRGDAAPSAQIKLKINGVIDPKPEPTDDAGKWVSFVEDLNDETTYQFIAVADYGDNAESNPWTITTGKQDVKPDIKSVKDSKGTVVLSGSTTKDTRLTVSGVAKPGQKVRLLKDTESLGEPEANGDGTWIHPITVSTEPVSLTAMALYGAGETSFPPYTFTVTPFGEVTNIVDSKNNPILEDGYTTDKNLTLIGKASPYHTVEIWNHNSKWKDVTADGNGDWRHGQSVSPGRHSITIKGKDIVSTPPRTFYVVANSQLLIDNVTDDNGRPIPNNGSVPQRELIHFHGSGAYQNSKLELYVDDIFSGRGDAEEEGTFRINTGGLAKGGPYRFQVRGANEQVSQDWYITIT